MTRVVSFIAASDLRDDRVGLEGPPAEHHAVPGASRDLHHLVRQPDTAGCNSDIGGRDTESLCKGTHQRAGGEVGVPVHVTKGVFGCRKHRWQRGEWNLVAGELVR